MVPSICFDLSNMQPNISQGWLHLFHRHPPNRWIYQKVLLSSDLESNITANTGDNKSLNQFFEITTDFESSWEFFQVDIFTCMSQNGIGVVIHTCAANVGSTKEELSSIRGFILICRMNFLTRLFHRSLRLKSIKTIGLQEHTYNARGGNSVFPVFPYVTHTVVQRWDVSL